MKCNVEGVQFVIDAASHLATTVLPKTRVSVVLSCLFATDLTLSTLRFIWLRLRNARGAFPTPSAIRCRNLRKRTWSHPEEVYAKDNTIEPAMDSQD
ncbi:hypothetical protein PoB_002509900 [Plakobranchus ocellatus]|uniref:Uncharacterized protein n=1 Tax=Plakobranchus ocellatus TaxID=259542 RepID=A0AAV3ZTD0_9GAST|nr:hypothetical protein PoB_002509900 [Plakobranchus ocellatus]